MDFEKTIPFDPGYNDNLEHLFFNVKYGYEQINVIKNFNQKKFQFQKFYPIFKKNCDNYVNFYIGCMLWALIIKKHENAEITGNLAYGQEFTDDEALLQVNCLREFIPQLERDAKYYLNKVVKFDDEVFDIIDIYQEFLVGNDYFKATKTSADLKITFKYNEFDYDEVMGTIEQVVKTGDFPLLYKYRSLFLDCAV